MSTKKASKKPAASKKATTKKAAAKKKSTTKKPAAKKPVTKKASKPATKATKKPAAKKKAATKPAKKTATKKTAAKKPAKKPAAKPAKKPSAKPAAKAKATTNTVSKASFTPPTEFTPLFVTLEEWVNGGKFDGFDLEAYQSFNEQYKPSDWTQNPETNQKMFSFAMDGTGGQFSIWNNGSSDKLEELPVVLLGSEGSTIALTQNVPEFFFLMASGVDPSQIEYGGISGKETRHADFMVFVKKQWTGRSFASPKEIFANAKKSLQKDFEAFLEKEMKK
jgi:hypothetical protein